MKHPFRHVSSFKFHVSLCVNKNKQGMILVMVVLITSAILAVGLGIFSSVFNQLRSASETKYSFNALYAADQGMERTLYLDRKAAGGPLCSGAVIDAIPDVDCYILTDFPVGNSACVTARVSKDIKCDETAEAGWTRIRSTGKYQCSSGELAVKRAFCLNYQAALVGGDTLLFFAATDSSLTANKYRYVAFYNPVAPAHTWVAGDKVEYDVYIDTNIAGLGGIDIYNTAGSPLYFRGVAGWVDQNGISGHPSANISSFAFQNWYHRIFTVPASKVGASVDLFDVAAEFDPASTSGTAYYDNVVIRDAGGTIVETIYESGAPLQDVIHLNAAYASHILNVAPAP